MTATIALVDDDRNILASVGMALEAEGFRVRSFTDGAEALRGLATQPADLVVLDIKMPRMDGMETLNRLRRTSDVPVIFLTSKEDEIDEVLGLKLGADDYIRKPFSQRLLIERIRVVLRRVEALREPPADGDGWAWEGSRKIGRGDVGCLKRRPSHRSELLMHLRLNPKLRPCAVPGATYEGQY